MSDSKHPLAEALRQIIYQAERGTLARCEQLARDALASIYEAEQQAGEAVAVVYSISGQSRTEDAYATVQILNSAGKGCRGLPVRVGTKLYTRPLEPLTQTKLIALWADKSDGPSNAEIVSFARAIERAHGIGITKDTK